MAAPMGLTTLSMIPRIFARICRHGNNKQLTRCLYSSSPRCGNGNQGSGESRDPAPLFLDSRVQRILQKVTGLDLDRIFAEIPADVEPPKYRLLTQQQLQELQDETVKKAKKKLQMPPVMKGRKDTDRTLADNPEIQAFDTAKFVFTDISDGLSDRERSVVVREPSGRLRSATWEERDYAMHTFFPQPGRMLNMPKMFEEDDLERILAEGKYLYVLNRACVQFEPDDHEFIRVANRTYEHIASCNQFDVLRSTRYFGCMTFYFAFYKNIDRLLVDMIQRDLLSDAADVVRLYHILHPDSSSAVETEQSQDQDHQQLIETFAQLDSKDSGMIELALQSYNEAHNQKSSSTASS